MEAKYEYLIHNDDIVKTQNAEFNTCGSSVYEVVRVIEKPIYLKEHIVRLNKSLKLLGIDNQISYEHIYSQMMKLCELNDIACNNIKILCSVEESQLKDVYVYHIQSNYPDDQAYNKGVKTIFYRVERENPNIKIHRPILKETIGKELKRNGAYEALLVDDENMVTEGSRSNLLFVSGDSIVTTKKDKVLLGVTRSKVIEICKRYDISITEREIRVDDISSFNAAFITGTSINVLPISMINDMRFDVDNRLLRRLIKLFEEDFKKDIL